MTVIDLTIVNVSLPTIGRDLHFSDTNLQWVVTAYALTFGGFLLLGGRAADLLGRRRILMVGLSLFTAAHLAPSLRGYRFAPDAAVSAQSVGLPRVVEQHPERRVFGSACLARLGHVLRRTAAFPAEAVIAAKVAIKRSRSLNRPISATTRKRSSAS
jgi:MFS family permease